VKLTLRARLALLYTGLLAVALLVFGAGGFLVLRGQLVAVEDAAVLANAEHAGGAFALDVVDGVFAPSERLLDQLASTGGRVVVLDADGHLLLDSDPSAAELPIDSGTLAEAAVHAHGARLVEVDGLAYRMAIEPVIRNDEIAGFVAWAVSTVPLDRLLGTVALALVTGGITLVGLALLVGWLLARRALEPTVDVTETARAISLSGDFGARVPVTTPHDEVGALAVAFNEMLAGLERSHQTLQEFLGDASHQLRTPLTSVRTNLHLAQRESLPESERRELIVDAAAEVERMGAMVADLLALARAESGGQLEFALLALDEVVIESARQQRATATAVTLRVGRVDPVRVSGDRDRLKDACLVLLDNALRYTPPGGSVTVTLRVAVGRARITVADTGIGLDPDDIPHIFDRLYRGSRARTLSPSGTGLGLAIAQWIVESHGGEIELANRRDGSTGTEATIELPTAGE
jgi:two-component system, OmpR family, sensor kinase